jgi:hypothetical protein
MILAGQTLGLGDPQIIRASLVVAIIFFTPRSGQHLVVRGNYRAGDRGVGFTSLQESQRHR